MNRGFIALLSTIIMSVTFLAILSGISWVSYSARFNVLASEYKEIADAASEGCAHIALKGLTANAAYTPPPDPIEIFNFNGVNPVLCRILSVEHNIPGYIGKYVIKTSAEFQGAVSKDQIVLNDSDYEIVDWNELP